MRYILISISLLISINLSAQYAVLTSAPVNLRDSASTDGKAVASLMKNYVILDYVADSRNTQKIKIWHRVFDEVWQIVKIGNMECYVYSPFLEVFQNYADAEEFVKRNKKIQKELKGSKKLSKKIVAKINYLSEIDDVPRGEDFRKLPEDAYCEFTFDDDGKFKISIEAMEGDHMMSEKGVGRFVAYGQEILFRAGVTGEFAPDGYSWEEYFELAVGHKPTKEELKRYIKKTKYYKTYIELLLPIEQYEGAFIDK